MAYRFTDTNKWHDEWFIDLPPLAKLLFNYLCDNCDSAGFFELSMKKLRDDLHPMTDEEIKSAFQSISKKYVLSRDKKILLLINFIKHQKNTPLNHRNAAHKGIFSRVENYKKRFAHDIIKLINKGDKPKQDIAELKGLQTGLVLDIGNIPFDDFYNLYNKKVGDKKSAQRLWQALTPKVQRKIMQILPTWKLAFAKAIPYPETFLRQERWNDEIVMIDKTVTQDNQVKQLPSASIVF